MITTQHLIALLPLLIIGLTVVVVMLSIAYRRNNTLNAILTIVGMALALVSCWFSAQEIPTAVTQLMRVDQFALFYSALVLIVGMVTTIFAHHWLTTFPDNKDEFYLLLLIATMGGMVLTMADHLIALFVGIELLSLPIFGLIGYAYRQRHSIEAALKYMLLSAGASAFLLFGIALLYAGTGELNFDLLGEHLAVIALPPPIILIGFGMIVIGIGFKLSLVPFQLWTPDVYQGSPSMVSFLLATTGKIAVFCVTIRLLNKLPIMEGSSAELLLILAAIASILFGNLLALLQRDIKRLMAYSSIAHMGYLLVILIALKDQETSIEAANIYFIGYLLSNIAVFGTLCVLSSPYAGSDKEDGNDLKGLFWRSPMVALSMMISLLSLAGIPLTFGFIGKFYLLMLGVYAQLWWIIAAIILGSALGLFYYLRVAVTLFLDGDVDNPTRSKLGISEYVVGLAGLLTLIYGVYPQIMIDIAVWAQLS